MKKFFAEFKKFISRGNVIDMAVGVIIASAFTAIVTAVTGKVIMPLINWLLAVIVGGNGLDSVYTFLKKVYVLDEFGMETSTVDYANSIYIDWGALIVAIINFFLIALILFVMLKMFNAEQEGIVKAKKSFPTKEEKQQLKAMGVDLKNAKEVRTKTAQLRAEKQAKLDEETAKNKKPTTDELLTDILSELKKNNKQK